MGMAKTLKNEGRRQAEKHKRIPAWTIWYNSAREMCGGCIYARYANESTLTWVKTYTVSEIYTQSWVQASVGAGCGDSLDI